MFKQLYIFSLIITSAAFSLSSQASNSTCDKFTKKAVIKELIKSKSTCYKEGGHFFIFSPQNGKTLFEAVNLKTLKNKELFPKVYEEEFNGKLSSFKYQNQKHKLLVKDINNDGFDELVILFKKDKKKELNIFTLNPKRQEYFGKIPFKDPKKANESLTLEFNKNFEVNITPSGFTLNSKSNEVIYYKGEAFSFDKK